jgi:hypothetical protein
MLSIVPLAVEPAARSWAADIAAMRPRETVDVRAVTHAAASPKQRTRIWELHNSLHCSIIGTCLTSGELRRLLVRLNVKGAETAGDHDLHMLGVLLANRPQAGAKMLQKTLDRRHEMALRQFAKAKDTAAICALWEDAMRRGDIPGAYWALLTHPVTTDAMVKQAFGEVHMLSHLVGAANRADIRRLRTLEEENAALAATLERQQRQLRDGFTTRDETIRRLTDALARKAGDNDAVAGTADDVGALTSALAERERRLSQESIRRERLERRLAVSAAECDTHKRASLDHDRTCQALRAELASLESQIGTLLRTEDDAYAGDAAVALDLDGMTVLYVGGRANQAPQLRSLVERTNGRFLHHDGGLEHSAALLPGLVSRADLAVFPVDCVSHDAVASLKRICRQMGKRYLPLRTASLACLLSGLAAVQAETAAVPQSTPL